MAREKPPEAPPGGEAWQDEAVQRLMGELRGSMETALQEQEGKVRRFVEQLQKQPPSVGFSAQRRASDSCTAATPAIVDPPATGAEASGDAHGTSSWMAAQISKTLSHTLSFETYAAKVGESIHGSNQIIDLGRSVAERRTSLSNGIARVFWKAYYACAEGEEPPRKGWLANIVLSPKFEYLALLIVLTNGVLIVYQADREASLAFEDPALLKSRQDLVHWDQILEYMCVAYYVIELALRLLVHRRYFFHNDDWAWNVLDFTSITLTLIDVLATILSTYSNVLNANFVRIIRILKMAKSLRIIRAFHFIRDLRRLLECMVSSLWQIFWSVVLITVITVMFATMVCQCVAAFILDTWELDPAAPEMQEDIVELGIYFGTLRLAMFTLFKVATGGDDWGPYYAELSKTGALAALALVLYILFFLIAAWNVVSSLFIERALQLAQPDMDRQMLEKRKGEQNDARDLLKLMQGFSKDKSGSITVDEFMDCMYYPRIHNFFESRGIDIKDAEMFFCMLQTVVCSDKVQLEILVNALMKMRGVAMNLDLQAIQFQQRAHSAVVDRSFDEIRAQIGGLASQLRLVSGNVPAPAREPPRAEDAQKRSRDCGVGSL